MGSSDLKYLRQVWNVLGEHDPFWAILSQPETRGGRWDVETFFASGAAEVQVLQHYFELFKRPINRHKALDFGCGVGRVTRALSPLFDQVIGVDIAGSMIDKAKALNAEMSNVGFIENSQADLRIINDSSIDLVYSNITLQHMPPQFAKCYIAEFLRILAPGGLAVFQLACDYDPTWRGRVFRWVPNNLLNPIRRLLYRSKAVFEMYILSELDVLKITEAGQGSVLHKEDHSGAGAGFVSRRFFIAKNEI